MKKGLAKWKFTYHEKGLAKKIEFVHLLKSSILCMHSYLTIYIPGYTAFNIAECIMHTFPMYVPGPFGTLLKDSPSKKYDTTTSNIIPCFNLGFLEAKRVEEHDFWGLV